MSKKKVLGAVGGMLNLLIACVIIVLAFYICVAAYRIAYQVFSNPVCDKTSTFTHMVSVEKGESKREIAKELEKAGIIKDSRVWYIRLMLSAYKNKIQPGQYELSASMDMDTTFQILSKETAEEQ